MDPNPHSAQSNRFQGKQALVTGASSGIGRAVAELLSRQGASVLATGRSHQQLAHLQLQVRCEICVADLSTADGRSALCDAAKQVLQQIDVLVVAAGQFRLKTIEDTSDADLRALIEINLIAPYLMLSRLSSILSPGASVVLVGSAAAHRGFALSSAYAATKSGLASLAKSLTAEWAHRRIRVNVVVPGVVDTPLHRRVGLNEQQVETGLARMRCRIPLQRIASAHEVAQAIAFLASDSSAYLAGSEVVVDGGLLAT